MRGERVRMCACDQSVHLSAVRSLVFKARLCDVIPESARSLRCWYQDEETHLINSQPAFKAPM